MNQQQIKNSVIMGFGFLTIVGVIVLIAYCFSRREATLNLGVVVGVWWWDINLDTSIYFPFCAKQNVSEIYLNASSFNSSVNAFIQDANDHNLSVYYVQSNKDLILNLSATLDNINEYKQFEERYPNNTFKGIIYDIDLQLFSDYEQNKEFYHKEYINFIDYVVNNITGVQIDFTISQPLYEEYEFKEYNYTNNTLCGYIIDSAHRVFVKSYAVEYDIIVNQVAYELLYADYANKTALITVNTENDGDSNSTFYEIGKQAMHEELSYVLEMLYYNNLFNYGFSIVHMKSWYNLEF